MGCENSKIASRPATIIPVRASTNLERAGTKPSKLNNNLLNHQCIDNSNFQEYIASAAEQSSTYNKLNSIKTVAVNKISTRTVYKLSQLKRSNSGKFNPSNNNISSLLICNLPTIQINDNAKAKNDENAAFNNPMVSPRLESESSLECKSIDSEELYFANNDVNRVTNPDIKEMNGSFSPGFWIKLMSTDDVKFEPIQVKSGFQKEHPKNLKDANHKATPSPEKKLRFCFSSKVR